MITGFEEQTKPLTDQEREVFLLPIINGLRVKVGKEKAVTNKDIVRGLKANCDIKIGEARVRKMINYIRNNDIIPCLIATSKGYYIAETKDEMLDYIVRLCEATRRDSRIIQGASPRASLALTSLSKASAFLQGRDYVLPKDVRFIFRDCIAHRLLWSPDLPDLYSRQAALQEIFSGVKAPSIR